MAGHTHTERTVSQREMPRFEDDDHREAYERYRDAAKVPAAIDGALRGLKNGMGGPAYDWPIIGQALVELEANGRTFNAASLRAFCQKLKATAPISDEERMKPLENGVF